MVGRMAYFWGWPLVDNANRAVAFSKAPEPGLMGGVVPIAYDGIAMLTDYVSRGPARSSPARTRTSCTASASCRWTRSPSSSRCRISATASGSMRSMTRAPTSSPRSASNTAPSPAST